APPGALPESVCEHMSHFKAVLGEQRRVDDNIMLRLNATAGVDCQALLGELQAAYRRRERDIGHCLGVLDRKIAQRQSQGAPSFSLETQRTWVDNEHGVERIVMRRSLAAFRSRCPLLELPAEYTALLDGTPALAGN
ncbi:hypothetical protein H4R19_005314, partial [Coemansia spiralis]